MPYTDRKLTLAQRLGCGVYAIFAAFVSAGFAINGEIGDCPEGNNCPSEFDRALMVYGVPVGFFTGGLLLTRIFMRDKN